MAASTSFGVSSTQAPKKVFMVRWASGVTRIRQRAVASPLAEGVVLKRTPWARMSWAKTRPSSSSRTLPMKAPRPPSEASAAMVLAADPPDISRPGPIRE